MSLVLAFALIAEMALPVANVNAASKANKTIMDIYAGVSEDKKKKSLEQVFEQMTFV